jgi:hypothetical protein
MGWPLTSCVNFSLTVMGEAGGAVVVVGGAVVVVGAAVVVVGAAVVVVGAAVVVVGCPPVGAVVVVVVGACRGRCSGIRWWWCLPALFPAGGCWSSPGSAPCPAGCPPGRAAGRSPSSEVECVASWAVSEVGAASAAWTAGVTSVARRR